MHRTRTSPAIAIAVALAVGVAAPARAQDEIVVPSEIDTVTVYEDRALVTRTAAVDLAAGTSRIVLENLPRGLDGPSLRARASGAQVLGVEIEAVHLVEENSEALRAAKAAAETALRAYESTQREADDAERRWNVLRSIDAKTAERASRDMAAGTGPDVDALAALLDFVSEQLKTARAEVARTQTAALRAKEAADAASRRVAELQGAGAKEERRAIVTLRADAERPASLELSYLIRGAAWRPVYALRVADDFATAMLDLGAEVQQSTGEDWSDVELELTTARPAAGASPPEPTAWRIGLPSPRPSGGVVAERSRAPAAARALDDAGPMEKADRLEVLTVRSGLVVAFGAHRRETVRSGARPARVSLGQLEITPDVVWTAFPRSTDDVFVEAKVTNTTGTPLPAGETRVYVGPDYVGPMALSDWGMDAEIRVGLGVDRQVSVEREELARTKETEGLFSKETVHTRRYRITLKNHRTRGIAARILDQIPVSGDEDLVVAVTETSLPLAKLPEREAETNTARGVLEWRRDVAAGSTLELRFAFEIRHPKDKAPWGLD